MSSGVIFENLPKQKQIQRQIHPTFLQEFKEYAWYFLRVFLIVVLVYIFVRTSIFDVIGISGKSMFPSYDDRDAIYIDQFSPNFSDYKRGDVVVLLSPKKIDNKRDLYIKRIIGLPGESVIIKGGQVFIKNSDYPEGVELDEKNYLKPEEKTYKRVVSGTEEFEEPLLGKDEYFVLGDNRKGSTDSRIFGKVIKADITGKEFYRILPPEKSGFFKGPTYNIGD